jgi:hypothetical protein
MALDAGKRVRFSTKIVLSQDSWGRGDIPVPLNGMRSPGTKSP